VSDWQSIYKDIEDRLAPQLRLDAWERTAYYHLLRHTRLEGKQTALFSIGPLSKVIPLSDFKVRDILRSLDRKGCTKNLVTRKGYEVTVYLPDEIPALTHLAPTEEAVDIETLDFFVGRLYLGPLLAREGSACFYCLATVTEDNCELDHLIPKASVDNNSYRNIVISCHSCNRKKGGHNAQDYLRALYRQGLLNDEDLSSRLQAIEKLQSGALKPNV
jgi:5-methylcytosine-specific restriction endonuclease McrA